MLPGQQPLEQWDTSLQDLCTCQPMAHHITTISHAWCHVPVWAHVRGAWRGAHGRGSRSRNRPRKTRNAGWTFTTGIQNVRGVRLARRVLGLTRRAFSQGAGLSSSCSRQTHLGHAPTSDFFARAKERRSNQTCSAICSAWASVIEARQTAASDRCIAPHLPSTDRVGLAHIS